MKLPRLLRAEKWQWMWSKDWILRFISLILAVTLWYMVGGEDKVDKNVMIPVEIINLPRDLVISNQFKEQIEVTVNGPRSLILEMSKGHITRQIDLSTATPGTNVIVNEINSIPVPRGVTVERIQPATIILSLDKLVKKHFPIRLIVTGKVPANYKLGEISTVPAEITITGPGTVLDQFDVLTTKPIDVQGLKKSMQLQVPLEMSPVVVDLIGETSVTAHIQILMETVEKTIKKIPVVFKTDGIPRDINPSTVSVKAVVPKVFIKQKMDLKTLFDVTTVGENGERRVEVQVTPKRKYMNSVKVIQVTPFFVTLKESE